MPKLARPLRSLALLPLVAAMASAIPAVRWCAAPMRAITAECLVSCEIGVTAAGARCDEAGGGMSCGTMSCDAMPCGATPCGADESRPCTGEPDGPSSGSPCSREVAAGAGDANPASPGAPAPSGPRTYCIESPPAATQGPGSDDLVPPALPAEALASVEVPEPASARPRQEAFEPPRPRARPPGLPPPVRGPPLEA